MPTVQPVDNALAMTLKPSPPAWWTLSLLLCWTAVQATPQAPQAALACQLGPRHTVVLGVRAQGLAGVSLSTTRRGVTRPAFGERPGEEIVGQLVMKACVNRTLLFAINHGPPYLKGVALRLNPRTQQIDRIDFAEKSLPAYLDVGADGMRLLFFNEGGEHDLRYTLYHSGQDTALPVDQLPPLEGSFRRHPLQRPQRPPSNSSSW